MRSLSGVYDQSLLSIDSVNNLISYNISNDSNNSSHLNLNDLNERIKSVNTVKETAHQKHVIGASIRSKSRVPEILMINKYYGLVPQKFTITSRSSASISSTPSSASGSSRRAVKSSPAKPRAKSSSLQHHHQRQERKAATREGKGHRSENDSPEPIKMVLVTSKGSTEGESMDESSTDPFGLVTKRMSVEKYKKWRHSGGRHKGINLNLQSPIGQTLSLLDNGFTSHARRNSSAEYIANRRVIKIDLNSVSWDEENYEVSTSPERSPKNINDKQETVQNKGRPKQPEQSSFTPTHLSENIRKYKRESIESQYSSCNFDNNGCITKLVNNDYKVEIQSEKRDFPQQNGFPEDNHFEGNRQLSNEKPVNEQLSSPEMGLSSHTNSFEKQEKLCKHASLVDFSESGQGKGKIDDASGKSETSSKLLKDEKVEVMKGNGKLSQRTISFDEKLLEGSSGGNDAEKLENTSKRRPSTAAGRCSVKTFNTPNNFNPPSKVIPWTQQKTAGGKPLTLAERRAKFQRVPSIHSSSSLSMEAGEDEPLSEVDSSTSVRPPSSAYKESRKPLYVMQPPEVPTMIAQINPNADEDIQIEIEKVALMLRKMQCMNNFSKSLDSGIEAEMLNRAKISQEGIGTNLKNGESTLLDANPADESINRSGSESSVSSTESNSFEKEIGKDNKLKSSSPPIIRDRSLKSGIITSVKDGPRSRQSSGNNSISNTSNNNKPILRKSLSLANQAGNAPVSITSKSPVQRPPLKKAVSISCEKELLKAADARQNEVNSANNPGKGGRPKTATVAGAGSSQRGYATGTRSIASNRQSVSSTETNTASPIGSQGSRNRKILIKKALMEINQSSVNLRRKWGTLGRPRTAPSADRNEAQNGTMSEQQHPYNAQQKRKPLKASPIAILSNGKMGLAPSGKVALSESGKSGSGMQDGNSEKCSSTTPNLGQRANSESLQETGDKSEETDSGNRSNRGRSAFRQSFSLDESALLGFSIKSVGDGRMPIFESLSESSGESGSTSILNDEISFLSSKKREQCLKVYEKMMKTGCSIKLDTIFRGMLTPSEYRAFMRAAEKATFEAEEKAQEAGDETRISLEIPCESSA